MKQTKYLFILFFLLQYSTLLYSQEISFYYDQIADSISSQSNSDQLIENLTRQIWNESSSGWENDSLYEYSYNNENFLDTLIKHKWRYGTVWGNEFKAAFNYDSDNKLIFENHWDWGGGWGEYERYYYSYYGSGNLSVIDYHGLGGGIWRYFSRTVYTWNEFNLVTRIAVEGPYPYNSWGPFWKEEFSYDSTNSLMMKEKFVHYLLSYWKPDLRDLYYYDDNNNNNEHIRQEWNNIDSIWINNYRYLYEYDFDNLLLSIIYQDWQPDSLDWENVWREIYFYTPQNQIEKMYKETWTSETGWNNYVLRTYFYDTNYNWTQKLTQLWDGSTWKDYYRHLATWQQPVSVNDEPAMASSFYLFQNYPNPFNPTTKIKFTIPKTDNPLLGGERGGLVTLSVYDILGNEITTLINEEKSPGTYELEFDGTGLTSGMYFYTLKAGNYSETKKMILLK